MLGKKSVAGIAGIILLVFAGQVWTEEESHERLKSLSIRDILNLSVEVASMREETIFNAPSSVTVIDRQMIREYEFQSITEAVSVVAGFDVLRTYIKRDLPTSRSVLQDHYANKVLIMINGVPSWMAVTGEGCLDRVDINDVERIEVLKGPASVLYGTNAYSGAVNIILKKAKAPSVEAEVGVSEGFGFRGGGRFMHWSDRFQILVAGNAYDDIGQDYTFTDERDEVSTVEQYMKSRNFTVSAQSKSHSLLFNVYHVNESFLGTTTAFALGAGKDHEIEGLLFNYTFTKDISDTIKATAGVTYDLNRRDFSRSFDDNTRANVRGYRLTGFAQSVFSMSDAWRFEAGANWEQRTSQEYRNYDVFEHQTLAENNLKDREISEYSVFAQANYTKKKLRGVIGTRFTDNELFGTNVSSRGTLVYLLDENRSIKLIAGQSYRVPSLFELYFQTPTNTVFGSVDLEPETSESIELAFLSGSENFFFEGVVYHAKYENKIFRTRRYPDFVDDPDDTSTQYVNGEAFAATGVELELKYSRPDRFSAFVNYGFVDGDEGDRLPDTDHYNFKYVPEHTIAAGLAKHFGRFSVSGVGRMWSKMGAPISDIAEQYTVDINLSYRQRLGSIEVRHVLTGKNLFNDEVMFPEYVRRRINEVPSGYGRRVMYLVQVAF